MPLIAFLVYALFLSAAANGENNEASLNMPVYSALVECVDGLYYDGGYMVGNKVRESLMTDVLALRNQPAYSEELMDKIREADIPWSEYGPVYSECMSGDLYEKVDALAKKHGVAYSD
jgi:hypothetical protein